MRWVYDDGGRAEAGYKGVTGDCVCRAIAIATERPYKEIYDLINKIAKTERKRKGERGKSNARTGAYNHTAKKVLELYGWKWVPTMKIGQGCKVHLTESELPKGRIVVRISHHAVAVIDGVIHDIYDPNYRGYIDLPDRCVYGYYIKD